MGWKSFWPLYRLLEIILLNQTSQRQLHFLRAAHLCRELRFYSVVLEGDALQVMQALRKDGKSWSRYWHIIEEAEGVLSSLQSWKVNHVKRNLNGTSHCLAKKVFYLTMIQGLIEKVPYWISDIIYVCRAVCLVWFFYW